MIPEGFNRTDYDYHVPDALIAQAPAEDRASCRLMRIDKNTGVVAHSQFSAIYDYLQPGDLLVFNNTKVIPSELKGQMMIGLSVAEVLLEKYLGDNQFEAHIVTKRRVSEGERIVFKGGLQAVVAKQLTKILYLLEFECDDIYAALEKAGTVVTPTYINRKIYNSKVLQTVYASELGAVASPAAGLHFTEELINQLTEKGIDHTFVTLHVGLGTFQSITTQDIRDYQIHSEHIEVSQEAADKINQTKQNGGRVICVGTTSCRTVESISDQDGVAHAYSGDTDIYIYPGYEFRVMDGLITNFHLPESSLIVLVSAFAGRENILAAYNEAVKEKYKFYTFGDACLII